MDRSPLSHRSAPAYPDRRSAGWVLRLLALGSALGSTALAGCETPPEPSHTTPDINALPGEMPAVEGDIQVADPSDPTPAEPGVEPTIPEIEPDAEPRQVEPRMPGVPPEARHDPGMDQAGEDPVVPDDVPVPGGIRAPVERDPMPGEPPAPAEPAPATVPGD
jgi:hypothetical protein